MVEAQYPTYDWEDGRTLLNAVGSFWAQIFADSFRLRREFDAAGEVFLQTQMDFLEAVAAVSRFEVPVFHRKRWHLIVLKRSDLLEERRVLAYGEGAVYGPQPTDGRVFTYGEPAFLRFIYDIAGENLADVNAFVTNRLMDPSVVLTKGIEFDIDRDTGTVRFDQDPFDNELFAHRPVYGENNEVVDEEIALWFFMGDFDFEYVYDHFGYALQVARGQSSEFYKAFINAYWNMFTRTATIRDVRSLLFAVMGIPSVIENVETVEFIETTSGKLQIITDQHVYKFQPSATAVVSVGDVVEVGDELVDAVRIIELSSENRDTATVPALSLGEDFLSGGFFSQLVFENRTVTLDYQGIDGDGKAIVQFEVGGFPGDVDLFWELVHERGKDMGATLAELLDLRDPPVPAIQPQPQNLPPTVNPMEFVIDNLLKNNLFIIRLKLADADPEAAGMEFFRVLRAAIMPHTTFIVFVETPAQLDIFDLGQQGGVDPCIGLEDDEPGAQDEFYNDESCTSVPLFNVFDGPATSPLDEVQVTAGSDPWIEDAMVRPRIIAGELL